MADYEYDKTTFARRSLIVGGGGQRDILLISAQYASNENLRLV